MFENNAKGWYGNYSVIGRNLIQRFALILRKDEILSGNLKKAFYGDYFTKDDTKKEEEEINNRKKKPIDIFSEEYDKLKEEKIKIENEEKMVQNANLCTHLCFAEKERYKFHQQHHKEIERNLRLIKRKEIQNLVSYHPRLDFIWKRTITGPKWKLLKGRKSIHLDNNSNKNDEKKLKSMPKNNINYFLSKYDYKSIPMHKMTKRGSLPINYDSRIRFDIPFVPKIITEETTNKYKSSKINKKPKKLNQNKFSKTMGKLDNINTLSNTNINQKYLKTYNNNFNIKPSKNYDSTKKRFNTSSATSPTSNLKKSVSNKKNLLLTTPLDKDTFNRTIDFSKILPRNYNVFVQKKVDETTPPFTTPNYKLTEPRCISMVSYSNDNVRDKMIQKKFEGIDPQIFLQPDKVLDLVNNHKKVSAPNFDIMSGRNQNEGPLPAYMINVWDRRSIETMTEKGLKMNNYFNSEFHNVGYSTFKPKKSYNKMINYTIMKNDNEQIDEELKNINEEVFGNKKLKKLIENYSKDDKENANNPVNFDVISLKSFKRERKKHKKKFSYPLNYEY